MTHMDRAVRPQKESGTDHQTGQLQEMKTRKQSELQKGREKEQENKTVKDRKAGWRSDPDRYIDKKRCDKKRYSKKQRRNININLSPIQANQKRITAVGILVAAGVLVAAAAIGRKICCGGTGLTDRSTNAAQSGAEVQHGGTASADRSSNTAENPDRSAKVIPAEADLRSDGSPVQPDSALRPRVALTFDDGPHPIYTKKLLDGLKSRGVHATFFVVGENIPGSEELIRRMAEEGHVIGNHTYDHVKLSGISDGQACEEVQKTDALVRDLTGVGTEFVRPPFGSWKKTLECQLEMIPVLWDVDPLDWTTKNTATVVQRVLNEVQPGDIVLLHDFYESSVDAALEITDRLLEQGYEFVTVDELILL